MFDANIHRMMSERNRNTNVYIMLQLIFYTHSEIVKLQHCTGSENNVIVHKSVLFTRRRRLGIHINVMQCLGYFDIDHYSHVMFVKL